MFGQKLEDIGCELMPTAAITPRQNAVCERHGAVWKTHARRLIDDFSIKFVPEKMHRVTWLTTAVTWACNSAIDDSGNSPAWVLGRGLRLDQTDRLSQHERITRDRAFSERIAMMSAAQKSVTSLRHDRTLLRAVLARSRAHGADPARDLFPSWRCRSLKAKREWAAHWHGAATIINLQHESLWLAHRITTVAVQQRSRPTRHSTSSCHLDRCLLLSAHRWCHLVVVSMTLRMCTWTSTCHDGNIHVTRPAARDRLISSIRTSLRRECKQPVFRCQELPQQPETPFSESATWRCCTCDATVVSQRNAFNATISLFSRRRDGA